MELVTFSMSMSLDGYIVGPDGRFDWQMPDDEVHQFANDEVRGLGVHLLGRRLYETMLYWDSATPDPIEDAVQHEFAQIWNPLPKVVFSSTLSQVRGAARLARGSLAEEIAALRADPRPGNIGIGGATLAAQAAALGLIDEYRIRILPVLVGGGLPFFAREERHVKLELMETRAFASQVVFLRYRVLHSDRRTSD